MKQFSTARKAQRNSELYREEKREEGDRSDQEEMRGKSKGERTI